jgi:hypothetical protein
MHGYWRLDETRARDRGAHVPRDGRPGRLAEPIINGDYCSGHAPWAGQEMRVYSAVYVL